MIKNGLYKHFKGGEVFVFGTAKTPEGSFDVLYYGMQNGEIYARPIESFLDETKNAEGETVQRFVLISEENDMNLADLIKTKIKKIKEVEYV